MYLNRAPGQKMCKIALLSLILALWVADPLPGQETPLPDSIISKTEQHFDKIQDYSVEARIEVDIPNLRMPAKNIKFFYKRPDKFKAQSRGFAIIPKKGFLPDPTQFYPDSLTAYYKELAEWQGITCHVIVIPIPDREHPAELTMWVDRYQWLILRITATQDNKLQSEMQFSYQNHQGIWVPDTTLLQVYFEKGIPDIERPSIHNPFGKFNFQGRFEKEQLHGQIRITFQAFAINQGLDDALFKTE